MIFRNFQRTANKIDRLPRMGRVLPRRFFDSKNGMPIRFRSELRAGYTNMERQNSEERLSNYSLFNSLHLILVRNA